MRKILEIDEKAPVVGITPEAVFVQSGPETATGILFGPPRHAMLLRKRLWYVWRAIHAWDMTIANTLFPAWNGGFDYLVIPTATATTTSTVDGSVYRFISPSETWATIRVGNGTGTSVASSGTMELLFQTEVAESPTKFIWLSRLIFMFTTSSLAGLEIISAYLKTICPSKIDYNNASPTVTLYSVTSTAADTSLAAADFQNVGTTAYSAAVTWANITSTAEFGFNATGLAAINKTGITKFALRYTLDTGDTAPSPIVSTQLTRASIRTSKAASPEWPRLYITTASGGGSSGGGISNVANIFGATSWV